MSRGRFKIGTFSRMTGFSAAVLRAWERRHGLLRPERPGGHHRLYTEDDLRVMKRVAALVEEGRSISEIAALGRPALLAAAPRDFDRAPIPAGSVLAENRLASLCRAVVAAARDLDDERLRTSMDEAFTLVSPRTAVERVVIPAVREIGERWHAGEIGVAGEHLVSQNLRFRLYSLLELRRRRGGLAGVVLCACVPRERHDLGLLVVALLMASAGWRVIYLGPDVPLPDLGRALQAREIHAVCLSVTRPETLERSLDELVAFGQRWAGEIGIHLGGLGLQGGAGAEALTAAGLRLWPQGSGGGVQALIDALTEAGSGRAAGGRG